jgi:TonB family protein
MFRVLLSVCTLLVSTIALSQMTTSLPSAEPKSPTSLSTGPTDKALDSTQSAAKPNSDFLALATSVPVTYPEAARQSNTQGIVVVKVTVNESGIVEQVENVIGDSTLVAAAADAVRRWKFQPFIKDGKAIKVSTKLLFRFAIADGKCTDGVKQATVTTPFEHALTVEEGEMRKLLCKKVTPVRSSMAELARVGGDVVMSATVDKDGTLETIRILSTASPLLNQSALDAVKQWRYRPYIVSGEPVPVSITLKVSF